MITYKALTTPEITRREVRNRERVRRLAAEGMVLLENNGALPMDLKGKRIALFGNGARHTVRGGTGSGAVNIREDVSVEESLERAGAIIVTKDWLNRYSRFIAEEREQYLDSLRRKNTDPLWMFWLSGSFRESPVLPLEEGELPDADRAVYILARNSGEGNDRKNAPGDFTLTDEEKTVITAVGRRYGGVTVVLNVGGVMDTTFFREEPTVNALLLMSQTGSAGGDALTDVLTGEAEPCGRLTTTWAKHYEDYPNAENFSHMNGNLDDEYYTEGIFVGYRWFDSFGKVPAYPFGYGMSYTTFDIVPGNVTLDDQTLSVKVCVTNTGSRLGREVVQLYVSAPDGKLPKPYQELRAFGKTKSLAPGESETITMIFPVSRMASYDEIRAAWVLEAGMYIVRVGAHSRNTKVTAVLSLDNEIVTRQLKNVLPLDCEMETLIPDRDLYFTYPEEKDELASAPIIALDGYTPQVFVPAKESELPTLIHELSVRELATLCVGTERGQFQTIGEAGRQVPGSAGDTASLPERGIQGIVMADGPAGIRICPTFVTDREGKRLRESMTVASGIAELQHTQLDPLPEDAVTYYQYCTAIPIATLLAQTWDMNVLHEASDIIGEEMELFGIQLWLAPGMNIHRNPLCGRNFEYYSEDPLLSGLCAAEITCGVQSHPNCGTTIKHFCCNNQEDNRTFANSRVTERALREIYLKGFEIAVKESQPRALMTSYNLLNGTHTANSYDLLTTVLRQEWGFQGFVMTDWGTTGEPGPDQKVKYPCSYAEKCIAAGNDLTMPGSQRDVERIVAAVEDGTLTTEQLRQCAGRVLRAQQ